MELSELETELEANPSDPNLHYKQGLLLAEMGEAGRAAKSWRKALELKPNHTKALNLLGTTYLSQNRLNEAEQLYRNALETQPDQPQILNALALVLSRSKSYDEAVEHWERATEIDPDYTQAHYNLSSILLKQGRDEAALERLHIIGRRHQEMSEITRVAEEEPP